MGVIKLNINGQELSGFDGQTILEIAGKNGIKIPTLCHDERVKMYGSCGLCVVEAEGSPKLLRSCSSYAANGMVIHTETKKVRDSRTTALELLFSDHTGDCRPPCVLACPAETDCQGYVGMIANGEYGEALKLVKDKIPLPASIGRVCPHPCEEACRRKLVEEPISIAALKRFVGDLDIAKDESYAVKAGNPSGKSVAVIGGGPGGLTAAYFLRAKGHEVTIYDAMPQMGGMLRYGIPEYRLPKRLLQDEIDCIQKTGVNFVNNVKIGKDITLAHLRDSFNAVIVAVGAWQSTGLGCAGEELAGVLPGIDFLRDVALGKNVVTRSKVAVVGGGNTAMDACRTALRLGAEKVYNIYRRTKNEMPAEEIEIAEAEEEGVIFKNLTNPNEVIGKDGKVCAVRLQIMELGEPDASGRRAPVPVPGREETIEVDTVIVAIGQKLSGAGFEDIEKTKWNTISADEKTFLTNLPGVFAIGDATNKGADIAISAIGEGKKAADMADKYLMGEELKYEAPYLVKTEKTAADFADREKIPRAKLRRRPAEERRKDFLEFTRGLTGEEAEREAARCLECGCHDYFECKLINLAAEYRVQPEKFAGAVHDRPLINNHPFIQMNFNKCILCGLCVRICDEVVGAAALGLAARGFNAGVKTALEMDLRETGCISCGLCVHACPTGALGELRSIPKQVPVAEKFVGTICAWCSVGCSQKLGSKGGKLLRSLPSAERPEDALLCMRGRFGFGEIAKKERLLKPLIKRGNSFEEITFADAAVYANKSMQAVAARYGNGSIAAAVSDRYTNEEINLIKQYANKALGTDKVFSFSRFESGLADVAGRDASTAAFDEMENTDLIVLTGADLMSNHAAAGMRVRRAVQNGAKLLLIGGGDKLLPDIAAKKIETGEDLSILSQIAKALTDKGAGKDIPGYAELVSYLSDLMVGGEAAGATELLLKAKKAVYIYEKNTLTRDAARLVADIALLCGHLHGARNGVIQLLHGANAQGLADHGIAPGEAYRAQVESGGIRGLFIFGEDIEGLDTSKLEFLAVQDLHRTATVEKANVVFPASSYAEVFGTYTSADGRVQGLKKAVDCPVEMDNGEQAALLSALAYAPVQERSSGKNAVMAETFPPARLVPPEGNVMIRERVSSSNELYVSLMKFAASNNL